jgi:hypothetical protein
MALNKIPHPALGAERHVEGRMIVIQPHMKVSQTSITSRNHKS